MSKKNQQGITIKKQNLPDWYSEVIQKAELADYAPVRGFMIIRPRAYSIWQKIQEEFNKILKKKNVKNAYFPLLIPESFFKKEAEHAEGFEPELAYIKNTEEGEKLALRPTSETIIYDSYSNWIRSWRDLPYKINQWCNIIRWEVKQTKPFLRTREFLWQEGHCAFADEQQAEKNMNEMVNEYKKLIGNLLAIPLISGKKSQAEKFPGAKTTMTIEALMPDGKSLQCGTTHNLGQGFSKAFNVKFKDKDEKEKYVWLTSWGFSTRLIGALIMIHGDDKGLIIPPKVANEKSVIIPIPIGNKKEQVITKAKQIQNQIKKFNPILDNREDYSPGWKFNEWELKGIPIRIEIGPKDLEKKQVTLVRRDTGEKSQIKEKDLEKTINQTLESIQENLLQKAKKFLDSQIDSASTMSELNQKLKQGKIVKVYMKDSPDIEDHVKENTGGANSRIIENTSKKGKCIHSGEEVNTVAYIAKSY